MWLQTILMRVFVKTTAFSTDLIKTHADHIFTTMSWNININVAICINIIGTYAQGRVEKVSAMYKYKTNVFIECNLRLIWLMETKSSPSANYNHIKCIDFTAGQRFQPLMPPCAHQSGIWLFPHLIMYDLLAGSHHN